MSSSSSGTRPAVPRRPWLRLAIILVALAAVAAVAVIGSLPVAFGDYGMTAPTSMRVLSIDENGTMEFQLQFRHA